MSRRVEGRGRAPQQPRGCRGTSPRVEVRVRPRAPRSDGEGAAMRVGGFGGWIVLAILCAAGALADPPAEEDQGPDVDLTLAELGKPYFMRYCASCHGASGRGDGPAAVSL